MILGRRTFNNSNLRHTYLENTKYFCVSFQAWPSPSPPWSTARTSTRAATRSAWPSSSPPKQRWKKENARKTKKSTLRLFSDFKISSVFVQRRLNLIPTSEERLILQDRQKWTWNWRKNVISLRRILVVTKPQPIMNIDETFPLNLVRDLLLGVFVAYAVTFRYRLQSSCYHPTTYDRSFPSSALVLSRIDWIKEGLSE